MKQVSPMYDLVKYDNIMRRLHEHLQAVLDQKLEWVGVFLQGSQNYGLDYEDSDIDTKVIVIPTFDDFVRNRKPISYTHEMPNKEHVDIKDIRLMFECFKKQNANFLEILFTKYRIINPKYRDIFQLVLDERETIAHYNNYKMASALLGMALQKQKALEHPYPTILSKIERFGFDGKQLSHALRMREFFHRFFSGEPFEDCLIARERNLYLATKRNEMPDTVEEARQMINTAVDDLRRSVTEYMESTPVQVDHGAEAILDETLVEILKTYFLEQLREVD